MSRGGAPPPQPPPPLTDIFPVFVGHIPASASPSDLRGLFERAGPVREVAIIAEHGFVNFADARTAAEAIQRYNGRRLKGSVLHVDYSEELLRHLREMGQRVDYTEDPSMEARDADGSDGRRGRRSGSPPRRGFGRRSGFGFGRRSPPRSRFGRAKRSRSPPRRRPVSERGLSPPPESVDSAYHSSHRSSRSPPPHKRRRRTRSPSKDKARSSESASPQPSNQAVSSVSSGSVVDNDDDREGTPTRDEKTDLRQLLQSKQFKGKADKTMTSPDVKLSVPGPSKRNVSILGSHLEPIKIKFTSNAKVEDRKIEMSSPIANASKPEVVAVKAKTPSPEPPKAPELQFQELYIGNLLNEVETSDVERLLEPYGPVVNVRICNTYALAQIDCDEDQSDRAISDLDNNLWMDNNITVKYKDGPVARKKKGPSPAKSPEMKTSEETRAPRPKGDEADKPAASSSPGDNESDEGRRMMQEPKTKQDRRIMVRAFVVHSAAAPKTLLADLTDLFSRHGTVVSIRRDADANTVSVGLQSSERQALNCISELNGFTYKGSLLRARFAEGSLEDGAEYRAARPVDFKNYPRTLVPASQTPKRQAAASAEPSTEPAVPIGVLPPSSSLGAFGAIPSASDMSSILRNVHAAMEASVPPASAALPSTSYQPAASSAPAMGPQPTQLTDDPHYLSSVEGEIYAVHSKIVLVHFYTGFSFQRAKFVPGQMYADGKRSLGYAMHNTTYHNWPPAVKSFLRQGAKVKMDVRRMSEQEIAEAQELSSQYVMYTTPLVWRGGRPADDELVLSQRSQRRRVLKGVITRLYPKWAALAHLEGEVFFRLEQYHHKTRRLGTEDSLLEHLAVGDVLAVECEKVDYLQMAEIARGAPGFGNQRTDNLKFMARLVWQLGAEMDPFSVADDDTGDAVAKSDKDAPFPPFDFISTSSTLNRQLPAEREAAHRSWPATVESVHLPAGGTLLLDESVLAGAADVSARRVYFHRSRLFVNGVKMASHGDLSAELVPGDACVVDVVSNAADAALGLPPYVYYDAKEVPWVATAVQIATRGRGARMARALRVEEDVTAEDACDGRVVFLKPPSKGEGEGGSAVVRSGVAVLDNGPFAGQRVEFEAKQCVVYGHSLAKADLSHIFTYGEMVKIKVKPYNSFCVDSLYVGQTMPPSKAEEQYRLDTFLHTHGLDMIAFQYLIKGTFPSRPFIPLTSQPYRGRILELKTSAGNTDGGADVVVIEAFLSGDTEAGGAPLKVEADRQQVFVFGHWMGKADLRHVLQEGVDEVSFEYAPALSSANDGGGESVPSASLVWVGDADDRPQYFGQATQSHVSAKMDAALWEFVKKKNMDEKMFRALVEGRLPAKAPPSSSSGSSAVSVTTADGATIHLDQETLAQAALLQQMKSSFGSDACLKAMMMIMKQAGSGPPANNSSETEKK